MKKLIKHIFINLLSFFAQLIIKKHNPKVIAIVGNVGKTTTKDAIFQVLKNGNVRKSQKSFNGEIGVPLTIIGVDSPWRNPLKWLFVFLKALFVLFSKKYPDTLILEIGTDHPGEIAKISTYIKPDVLVLTALPKVMVHSANFSSREEQIKDKLSILKSLKDNAVIIYNLDDKEIEERLRTVKTHKLTYASKRTADIEILKSEIAYKNDFPIGMLFEFKFKDDIFKLTTKESLGYHIAYALAPAFLVGKLSGLKTYQILENLVDFQTPNGRMRIIKGVNETIVIDDSYNSSPRALSVGLDIFNKLSCNGRKIAVLGDMRELGDESESEHKKAGVKVAGIADILLTIGEESKKLKDEALKSGMNKENVFEFGYNESQKAGNFLAGILKVGDCIFVKGSQNKIRTEKVVEVIMKDKDQASNVLVRQSRGWKLK